MTAILDRPAPTTITVPETDSRISIGNRNYSVMYCLEHAKELAATLVVEGYETDADAIRMQAINTLSPKQKSILAKKFDDKTVMFEAEAEKAQARLAAAIAASEIGRWERLWRRVDVELYWQFYNSRFKFLRNYADSLGDDVNGKKMPPNPIMPKPTAQKLAQLKLDVAEYNHKVSVYGAVTATLRLTSSLAEPYTPPLKLVHTPIGNTIPSVAAGQPRRAGGWKLPAAAAAFVAVAGVVVFGTWGLLRGGTAVAQESQLKPPAPTSVVSPAATSKPPTAPPAAAASGKPKPRVWPENLNNNYPTVPGIPPLSPPGRPGEGR
jgi:hypothetical protein